MENTNKRKKNINKFQRENMKTTDDDDDDNDDVKRHQVRKTLFYKALR